MEISESGLRLMGLVCITVICLMGLATGHDSALISLSYTIIGLILGISIPAEKIIKRKRERGEYGGAQEEGYRESEGSRR